jgi:GTP-binding protein HflX
MIDAALSPGEHRSLAKAIAAEVIDRPQLILRLFALRARTREAQLTVQIAQERYALPRLRDDTSKQGREGGGGRGERGNTQVALAKERARARIRGLERELERVQQMAERQRARRQDERRVALVGYTNAGKSSWLRALTGSETLIADKPFATLDTTVRALARKSASPDPVLITDTVGFLRDLPHELVPSFRATLVEAREAELCLVVVDASDANFREQLEVTERTLDGIGASDVPRQLLFNKIDRVDAATRERLADEWPHALQVSSASEASVAQVRALIVDHFELPE